MLPDAAPTMSGLGAGRPAPVARLAVRSLSQATSAPWAATLSGTGSLLRQDEGGPNASRRSCPDARSRSAPGIRSPPEPRNPGRRADLLLGNAGDQPRDR